MTTESVARELIQMLKSERNIEAIRMLYDDKIDTVEADPTRSRKGKQTVLKSMQDFADSHDFKYTKIEGPIISGGSFALRLAFDAKNRSTGDSFSVDEIAVYTVLEGRIVREQFYY